jgi:bifunctional DNase/RNase
MPALLVMTAALGLLMQETAAAMVRSNHLVAADEGPESDGEPILVHLAGIRMVGPEQALLILADEAERRAVPIAVGRDQGLAIYLGQEKTPTPRPMTHDLIVQILNTLGVDVEKVIITALRENTYYAEIALKDGRKSHRIDARPSDAIALAVRLEVSIFASPELLSTLDEEEPPALTAEDGRKLGLSVQELESELAEYLGAVGVPGVLVASVVADSPAARAGLRRGDILQSLDGRSTADLEHYRDAVGKASRFPSFDVWREGEQLTLVRP